MQYKPREKEIQKTTTISEYRMKRTNGNHQTTLNQEGNGKWEDSKTCDPNEAAGSLAEISREGKSEDE